MLETPTVERSIDPDNAYSSHKYFIFPKASEEPLDDEESTLEVLQRTQAQCDPMMRRNSLFTEEDLLEIADDVEVLRAQLDCDSSNASPALRRTLRTSAVDPDESRNDHTTITPTVTSQLENPASPRPNAVNRLVRKWLLPSRRAQGASHEFGANPQDTTTLEPGIKEAYEVETSDLYDETNSTVHDQGDVQLDEISFLNKVLCRR
jgi:hypothetical protein